MNNFFSGTNPDLISKRALEKIKTTLNMPNTLEHPKWAQNFSGLYTSYIQPNLFPIIVFILILLFLFIKYVLKKDKEENDEGFDPSIPIKKQKNRNYYIGDNIQPIKSNKDLPYEDIMDEEYITDNNYEHPDEDQDDHDYRYEKYQDDREIELGDTYYKDPEDAIRFGANTGRRSIDDVAKILFN